METVQTLNGPAAWPIEIKSNALKISLRRMFMFFGLLLLIGGGVLMIHYTAGLDVFITPLEAFNIDVNPVEIIPVVVGGAAAAIIIVIVLIIAITYLGKAGERFEFRQADLVAKKGGSIGGPQIISYQNVTRISCQKDGVFNTVFNCGDIILELTGLDKSSIMIECADSPERYVQALQRLIHRTQAVQQARFSEQQKIGLILDRKY